MAGLNPIEESVAALDHRQHGQGRLSAAGHRRHRVPERPGLRCRRSGRCSASRSLDPPGVGARDLRECLLLQIRAAGNGDSLRGAHRRATISACWRANATTRSSRDLGVTLEEVVDGRQLIATLEPKPGRNFGEGDVRYITPDVFVQKIGDELVMTLNDEGLAAAAGEQLLPAVLGESGTGDAKRYIQEKMRAAAWLIKSIQQRQRTLYLVTQSIVRFQRDFFDHGVSHLKPLVLKDVAMDIGMHESTVSRATANKYVHTPQGTFELKYFFTSSLQGDGRRRSVGGERQGTHPRDHRRTRIRKHPLSDQHIAKMLASEHVGIARRTVAKYREMMGVLPSSKRRQAF